MAKKIKFDDIVQMERLFTLLSDESASVCGQVLPFKDWELLHELDRQAHRHEYDHSPERREQRKKRLEERARINDYLAKHPEVETKLKEKLIHEGTLHH